MDLQRWTPLPGEEGATVLAVLPWLGVPVLVSALLADVGRPIPGEALAVVAFLPLVAAAFAAALRVPAGRRALVVGLPGAAVAAGLLAFLAREPGPGSLATLAAALAASVACCALLWAAGRRIGRLAAMAGATGASMAFSQGLDGWLTYLAVGNPFGWLAQPATERVALSRLLLEAAPALYPALKLALAVALAVGLARGSPRPASLVLLALAVCYAGLSPAMYSAANLFAR